MSKDYKQMETGPHASSLVKRRLAHVKFENEKYNYSTPINGTPKSIRAYFEGKWFNMGNEDDDMQRCIKVEIDGETK